jgi:hypothetical protein
MRIVGCPRGRGDRSWSSVSAAAARLRVAQPSSGRPDRRPDHGLGLVPESPALRAFRREIKQAMHTGATPDST